MTTKLRIAATFRTAIELLFIFCAFQVLQLQIPLALYENGGGLSALALCVEKMLPPTLYPLFLFGALAAFRLRAPEQSLALWEKLFCCGFSLFLMIGDSYAAIDSWDLVFGSAASILLSAATLVGLTAIVLCALRWLKHLLGKLLEWEVTLPTLWQKHPFLFPWAVIFLCWLPYILVRLPAAIDFDAYIQIETAFGIRPLTAYNPVFSTLLIGNIIKLGAALFGSNEAGLTLFIVFQALIGSAIFAYTTVTMGKLKVPVIVQMIALGIYSIATIYPNYMTVILKDSLYSAMSILLLALIIEEVMLPHSRKRCVGIFAAALLTGLLRNNGFLILWACCAAAIGCLLVSRNRKWRGLVLALVIACILQSLYSNALLPALGVPEGPMGESLSIPFQQTARYVRDYPEDVTEEEAAAIAAVLDYENLAELYDPNLSDPVKGSNSGNSEALPEYFKVWFKQFFRHPTVYIQATLNNAYGFFHPNSREYIFWYTTISTNEMVFDEIEQLYPLKIAARYLVMLFETFPLTMPLCNTGCNMWLALYLLCSALARRDRKLLFPFASVLISMLVCIACPVFLINGIRYALPVIYAVPLLSALSLRKENTDT